MYILHFRNPRRDLMKMRHLRRWLIKELWNYKGVNQTLQKPGILFVMSLGKVKCLYKLNPLTLMNDQEVISPNNVKQTSDNSKEKYQLGDYKYILYQIPHTNIIRTVWRTVRRINNEILGVKGLRLKEKPLKWKREKLFISFFTCLLPKANSLVIQANTFVISFISLVPML